MRSDKIIKRGDREDVPKSASKEMDKDKSEGIDIVLIESDSAKESYYPVNTRTLTCTCPHFHKKLQSLSIEDPHRLCKHLIKAVLLNGIPSHLEKFREDIEWFAKYNSAFTSKEQVQKTNKTFLTEAGVKTTSFKKAIKYYYLQGEIADIIISATIPIKGGVVYYKIGQYTCCSYNLNTGESNIPKKYWHVEQSIINWLVNEYNKANKTYTFNFPEVIPKIVERTPKIEAAKAELPEGSIKTISVEERIGVLWEEYEDPDILADILPESEKIRYYRIVGKCNDELIHVSICDNEIVYSINDSEPYIHVYSGPITTEDIEECISDKFPKRYNYMEKAVIKWLTDEYNKLKDKK